MHIRLQHLLFAALVVSLVSLAYGINFMYFSDVETTRFSDVVWFFHGDTLEGPVRSNGRISIMQDPQFYDYAVSAASDFWRGSGYNPGFHTARCALFDMDSLRLPTSAAWFRAQAIQQNHYFNRGDTMQAKVHIEGDSLRIWWTRQGAAFDTTDFSFHALPDSAIVFFDCPKLDVWGTVSTTLILATSGQAGLADNLLYASSNPSNGRPTANHAETFALVAENDVKILNTWVNGRENSNGRGQNQTDLDSSSIALNGFYFSLNNSFTFDQQNDADSGYVYRVGGQPHSDDRGMVYLWGGITQHQRGYVHRATNGSTGYSKQYRYDNDLRFWHIGVFDVPENVIQPSAVNFGNVMIGDTVRDTVRVVNDYLPMYIDSVIAPPQYQATLVAWPVWICVRPTIAVAFAPSTPGMADDTLRFYISYYHQWFSVPVSGVGIPNPNDANSPVLQPSSFSLSSSPNPFNSQTRITFSLPREGDVSVAVFDVTGRKAQTLLDTQRPAGTHSVAFDAAALPSGVYFVRLQSAGLSKTEKLLLLR